MRRTWTCLLLLALAPFGQANDGFVHVLGGDGPPVRPLHLVAERPLRDLLPRQGRRFEASGVVLRGKWLYVAFDDTTEVARVRPDLSEAAWIETDGRGGGYEGITWSAEEDRFYCVVEALRRHGGHRALIATYDCRFNLLEEAWLDVPLAGANKGIEGLAAVHRDGEVHLLALHEGHPDDAAGDGAVRGRIEVYRARRSGGWKHVETIKLPKHVRFADWSGLDVRGDRVVVCSQQSSALWEGRLAPDAWKFVGPGQVYLFPRDADGQPRYPTVEGVALLDAGRVAVVTDLDRGETARLDRSIHIFALRAGAE